MIHSENVSLVTERELTAAELAHLKRPRWRVVESPASGATTVYFSRRPSVSDLVEGVLLIAVGIAFLVWFAGSSALSPADATVFAPLLGLVLLGVGVSLLFERFRRAPAPLFSLDETGFECAGGRVGWSEVQEIELYDAAVETMALGLQLRAGARLVRGGRHYASGDFAPTVSEGPPMRLAALVPSSIRAAVSRFFSGPVRDMFH